MARTKAIQIAKEVDFARELLIQGKTNTTARKILQEVYGLKVNTALSRLREAKQIIVQDMQAVDRQTLAAQLMETAHKILDETQTKSQYSNSIGALRFISELSGLIGKSN